MVVSPTYPACQTRAVLRPEGQGAVNPQVPALTCRVMLETRDCGSGGGASPGGSAAGGEASRNLADQVKALRSRVDELLERAKDAEVSSCDGRDR